MCLSHDTGVAEGRLTVRSINYLQIVNRNIPSCNGYLPESIQNEAQFFIFVLMWKCGKLLFSSLSWDLPGYSLYSFTG